MPDAPHDRGADPVREEVFQGALGVLHGAPRGAHALLRPLFEGIPTAELAERAPEALAAAAASLAGFAAQRAPGEIRLRLLPPGGGRGPHAVVEVVNDDMPFLVDSVLAALNRTGRMVREFQHPILAVTRDTSGALLALGEGEARESLMRITIAGTPAHMLPGIEPAGWPEVEAALRRSLTDTQLAVRDFPSMLGLMDQATAEVQGHGEAAEFLAWLRDENFVLLGHRRLVLEGQGARVVAEENFGLLRDMTLPVFDALRGLPELPQALRTSLLGAQAITVAKANMRSTVHRPQHADVIATRITDAAGNVTGGRLFIGLFAAAAYNRNPRSIPLLRGKVERILDASGIRPDSHDGRALRNTLDTWPRDELFQASEEAVLEGARVALDLTIRPRPALFTRRDPFGRFVSIIAWLPREGFDTRQREKVGGILARAHGGRLSAFHIALGDAPLARVHYIIGTDPANPVLPGLAALEAAVVQATRSFADRLMEAVLQEAGAEQGARLLARWRDAFPPSYRDAETLAHALADIHLAQDLPHGGRPRATLSRLPGNDPRAVMLRLASPDAPLALADALPLFESLDLHAIEEVPYRLEPAGGPAVVLHVYRLQARADVEEERLHDVIGALHALLAGWTEADGFNRLVLREIFVYGPARRGRAPALRPGGARRPALVRPARGLPHRGARAGQGADGQERGHRAGGAKGGFVAKRPRPAATARPHGRGHRLLQDLHQRPARHHRQPGRRPSCRRPGGAPRRRRPLPRGRRRQGHRDLLRHRQRDRRGSTASGWATPSPRAARRLRPQGMGITARGAWESVKRHFREMGKDIQSEDFTVVGVGDMSGDVFGNGMLLSRATSSWSRPSTTAHLPRPRSRTRASSFAERQRMFELPRSSWDDYDRR
jgi:glutamate dehydrogenase